MPEPISRTQLENASSDADSLGHFVNDGAAPGTYQTRTGRQGKTLAKLEVLGADAAAEALATLTTVETIVGSLFGNGPVLDGPLNAVPAGPRVDGERYIISHTATGAWAGHSNQITRWDSTAAAGAGAWIFGIPSARQQVSVVTKTNPYRFAGGRWNEVLFSEAGASFQNFADLKDGTLPNDMIVSGDGKPFHAEGAGAATESVIGGKLTPTIAAVGGNCYNVLNMPYPEADSHVEAEFQWVASGATANYALARGHSTIIGHMVHAAGPVGGDFDVTVWGASYVSTFGGVPQPNILESELPGLIILRGPGSYPVAGEKFRLAIFNMGEITWITLRDKNDALVTAKGFKFLEMPGLYGLGVTDGYAYAQSQGSNVVSILSIKARPLDKAYAIGLLTPYYFNTDPNIIPPVVGSCVSATFKDVLKIAVPNTAGNFGLELDVAIVSAGAVPDFCGCSAKYRTTGGAYTNIAYVGPTLIGALEPWSSSTGTKAVTITTLQWHDNGDNTLTLQLKATKGGADSDVNFTYNVSVKQFGVVKPTIIPL